MIHNQYGTSPASTGTLNDYRVGGYIPEERTTSTTTLVMASLLVAGVLAVDAYVFFGPRFSSPPDSASAPATGAVPASSAPSIATAPTMKAPVAPTPAPVPAMHAP